LTEAKLVHPLEKYTRKGMIPHIWCAGCGDGIILTAFLRAIEELQIDLDKLVVVSGIGCIGRISGYVYTDAFHTTHGRAIAFALGVKVVRPDLHVVVFGGDGDLFAIGGNHFIHAARRNIDIKVICANNFNYGMTGGQFAPTTPLHTYTTTTPYRNIEHPFNLVYLAAASGAVYVARWAVIHPRRLKESIKKALTKRGFTFIEVISPCPSEYGRRNKLRDPLEYMRRLKEICVIRHHIDPADAEISPERIIVGEFVDIEKPEYTELMWDQIRKIREMAERGEIGFAI